MTWAMAGRSLDKLEGIRKVRYPGLRECFGGLGLSLDLGQCAVGFRMSCHDFEFWA